MRREYGFKNEYFKLLSLLEEIGQLPYATSDNIKGMIKGLISILVLTEL